MTINRAVGPSSSISIPESISKLLRDLIHEQTGIYFESDKMDLMLEKLEPRVKAKGCQSYLDYFYLLKYDASGEGEWRRLMDAFSVQETYFWREYDQIGALVDHIVPNWFKNTSKVLRIWSAACASGEEPYSIAIALDEAGWGRYPIEILGSDASEAALDRARKASYRERSFRALPRLLREKYFRREGEEFKLSPEVVSRVTLRWANLMKLAEFPECSECHVIFCRNVFIYFSAASITKVVSAFAARMEAGAPLFIGASESLFKLTKLFELGELGSAFVYRRGSEIEERSRA
jgi:chemotaxis protein methyltransferase CheR